MTSSPYTNEAKSESSDPSTNNIMYEANSEYTGQAAVGGHSDMMMDDIVDSTDDLEDLDDFDTENTYGHLQKKSTSGGNGGSVGTSSTGGGSNNEMGGVFEDDKKKRRAIANSNERRRMQSINAGFQTLKSLIPHSSGEKLSKACILQRSAEHMKLLSKEKEKLSANFQLALKIIESNGLLSQYQTSSLVLTTAPSQQHQSHHHGKSTVKHLVETTNNNIVQQHPDPTSNTTDSTLISSAQSANTGTPVKSTTTAANITSKRKSISSLVNSPPPSSSTVIRPSSGLDSSLIVKSPSNKISAHLSQQQFIQEEMKDGSSNQSGSAVSINRQLTDATNLNKPPYSSIASIANIAAAAAAAVVAANQPTSVYPISTATSQPIQLTLDTTAKKLNEIFVTDHTNGSSGTTNQQPTGNIIQLQPATNASGLQLNLNALDIRLLNGSGNATASDLILPTAVILDTSRAVLQPLVAANSVSTNAPAIITQQPTQQHQSDTDDNEEEFEEYDDEPDEQESNSNKSSVRHIKPSTHVVANTKPIKIKNMTTNTISHHHHSQHPSGVKSARSNSIDQLIAAAVATSPSSSSTCSTTSSASTSTASSVSNPTTLANMGTSGSSLVTPTVSFQPSSSSINPASSNPIMIVDDVLVTPAPAAPSLLARKNLNTIVEAIKHVEGKNYVDEFADMNLKINTTTAGASCSSDASSSSGGSSSSSSSALAYSPGSGTNKEAYLISKVSPTAQKPPKKRKYTTEDLGNLAEPSQQQLQQQQIVPTNRPGSPTNATNTAGEGFLSLLVKSN